MPDGNALDALIDAAQQVLRPRRIGHRLFGDVAAALATPSGRRYTGVCLNTGSGTAFCAEQSAVAAMVTAGDYQVVKVVAVWRDRDGDLYVLPPCGQCRELMRQVDERNLAAEVLLGQGRSATLAELLPHHGWPAQREDEAE